MFDPNRYARDVLQIGSVIKHITTIEDYQANCRDEFESCDHAFIRLTMDQLKMYEVDLDVEGVEDDGKNMYSNTDLTKLKGTTISFEPYKDVGEDLDVMMAWITKRIEKWTQWTTTSKSQSKSAIAQASLAAVATPSSQGYTSDVTLAIIQGSA